MALIAVCLLLPGPSFAAGTDEDFIRQVQSLSPAPLPGADVPASQEGMPVILVDNFGVVADGIYRGRRLQNEIDYQFLTGTLGVETIVNLRWLHADDAKLCAEHRLNCVRYPIRLLLKDEHFDWKTLKEAYGFVLAERKAGRKVYFHCDHGSDRTGALAAAVMIRGRACGKSFDKDELWGLVDKTMQEYGFHSTYHHIHETVKSWVYRFSENPWLCQ